MREREREGGREGGREREREREREIKVSLSSIYQLLSDRQTDQVL